MAGVLRMSGDEPLPDADEPEHAGMLVVEVDQLDHDIGRLGGRVVVLGQLGLELGRFLDGRIDLRRLDGRLLRGPFLRVRAGDEPSEDGADAESRR